MTDAEAGWQALSSGRWEDALTHFMRCEGDPDSLEGIAVAHWWLDDADGTIGARERAYRLYRSRGDAIGAARVASALAWDSLLFGGRTAVARGWLGRASRLLADQPLHAEHAWLAVREAEVALSTGEPERARAAAERAVAIGAEVGDADVQVVARSVEGFALVNEGAVAAGMRRLDESAAAATAGDVADLMWIGKVCCNLIAACELVGDVERATQWCAEVKEFAQRWELRTLFNVCRTQYAAVLLQQGAWDEAEEELAAALDVFGGGRRAALLEGTARLGELRRRQGRLDEARALFAQAEPHAVARRGTVELALDEGHAEAGLALAQRLARASDGEQRLSRIEALSLVARTAVAAQRIDIARPAVAELAELAELVATTGARATSATTSAALAEADGELDHATTLLEDAIDLHAQSPAPYECARARLSLARVLRARGYADRAAAEIERAESALRELGVKPPTRRPGPLTNRELEVIALVSAGRSNREIASKLVISEHTVHRHVANILRKLGEPTRAAAAARATRDALV